MSYDENDRSELELRFEELFENLFGCPIERILIPQYRLEWKENLYRIDYVYENGAVRIAIELDGHGKIRDAADSSEEFRRLLSRQNDIIEAGFKVYRLTWHDVVHNHGAEAKKFLKTVILPLVDTTAYKGEAPQKLITFEEFHRKLYPPKEPNVHSSTSNYLPPDTPRSNPKSVLPSNPASEVRPEAQTVDFNITRQAFQERLKREHSRQDKANRLIDIAKVCLPGLAFVFILALVEERWTMTEPVFSEIPLPESSTVSAPAPAIPVKPVTSSFPESKESPAPQPVTPTKKTVVPHPKAETYIPAQTTVYLDPFMPEPTPPTTQEPLAPVTPSPIAVKPVTQEWVVFNQNTGIYHQPHCYWAQQCTRNCISVLKSQAIDMGGRAAKTCDRY